MEFLNDSLDSVAMTDILRAIKPRTAYGNRLKLAMRPYKKEELCQHQYANDLLELTCQFISERPDCVKLIDGLLVTIKDLSLTMQHIADGQTLSTVECYEIKLLLLTFKRMIEAAAPLFNRLPTALQLEFCEACYHLLDPRLSYVATFYIEDAFSEELAAIRSELARAEDSLRKAKGRIAKALVAQYATLRFRPNGTVVVDMDDKRLDSALTAEKRLRKVDEHYRYATYGIVEDCQMEALNEKIAELKLREDEAVYQVRRQISQQLGRFHAYLSDQLNVIAELDFLLAKAKFTRDSRAVRPHMVSEGSLTLRAARHLKTERLVQAKGRKYTPIDIVLDKRVTLITGANMGGKTIALKTVGQCVAMAHYGLFVPAKFAEIPYYTFMSALIGDEQSINRGLSTFGAEVVRLIEAMTYADNAGLLLIDELARGTNPDEGFALSESLIKELSRRQADVIVTTHYSGLGNFEGVKHLSVVGLTQRPQKLDQANAIAALSERMDYRLVERVSSSHIAHDAIDIAEILGMPDVVVQGARTTIKQKEV